MDDFGGKTRFFVVVVCVMIGGVYSNDSSVVLVLDDANFDDHVGKDMAVLVKFFAPWCGHCQELAPEYEKAAHTLDMDDNAMVVFAEVDAERYTSLAERYKIEGYPTLKWFPANSSNASVEEFMGENKHDDVVAFVHRKLAEEPNAEAQEEYNLQNPHAEFAGFDPTLHDIDEDPTDMSGDLMTDDFDTFDTDDDDAMMDRLLKEVEAEEQKASSSDTTTPMATTGDATTTNAAASLSIHDEL